jgi:hypothetical protein
MSTAISISFDPWDLSPDTGDADGCFIGDLVGTTRDGYWIVQLRRAVRMQGRDHWRLVLTPRYVDQPTISSAGPFPYTSAAVFVTKDQVSPALDTAALAKMPGLVGAVRPIEITSFEAKSSAPKE